MDQLVVQEELTEPSSSFTRRDLLQQLAGRLPNGAPVTYVEQAGDAILTHDTDLLVTHGHLTSVDVIRRDDGRIVPVDTDEPRYTTKGLLLTEQETMVRRLTIFGAGVEVVVGKAGTGKTYALDAARDAWQTSGIQVTGVALATRAALELQASAGIRATTLARLLGQLDDHREGSPLAPGSVLVVDEAGMIGTRQLAQLLYHAETQSIKVVLVGDPKQLPEIDAGGLFRALATRLPAIELTDNRRQQLRWEQAALDELHHGNPDAALTTYRQHGHIHTADTAEQIRAKLVDDWWDTARDDLPGSIMIAPRGSRPTPGGRGGPTSAGRTGCGTHWHPPWTPVAAASPRSTRCSVTHLPPSPRRSAPTCSRAPTAPRSTATQRRFWGTWLLGDVPSHPLRPRLSLRTSVQTQRTPG